MESMNTKDGQEKRNVTNLDTKDSKKVQGRAEEVLHDQRNASSSSLLEEKLQFASGVKPNHQTGTNMRTNDSTPKTSKTRVYAKSSSLSKETLSLASGVEPPGTVQDKLVGSRPGAYSSITPASSDGRRSKLEDGIPNDRVTSSRTNLKTVNATGAVHSYSDIARRKEERDNSDRVARRSVPSRETIGAIGTVSSYSDIARRKEERDNSGAIGAVSSYCDIARRKEERDNSDRVERRSVPSRETIGAIGTVSSYSDIARRKEGRVSRVSVPRRSDPSGSDDHADKMHGDMIATGNDVESKFVESTTGSPKEDGSSDSDPTENRKIPVVEGGIVAEIVPDIDDVVDMAVQNALAQRDKKIVRGNVVAIGDSEEQNSRKMSTLQKMCCLFMIVVGAVVGVLLATQKEQSMLAMETQNMTRVDTLKGILAPFYGGEENGHEEMFPYDEYQKQALVWIADQDDLALNMETADASIVLNRYMAALLYFSLDGANWKDESQERWLSRSPVCFWNGLTCNEALTEVTHIDLAAVGLSGTIPTDLGILTNLSSLYLSESVRDYHRRNLVKNKYLLRSKQDKSAMINGSRMLIIGGKDAPDGRWPYFAHAHGMCGGTLIHRDLVLTAGHCASGWDMSGQNISIGGTVHQVGAKDSQIHPLYDSGTQEYDVGIIKLRQGISSIAPVRLNRNPNIPGNDNIGTIFGMGYVSNGGPLAESLQEANVTMFSPDYCMKAYEKTQYNSDIMICAGAREGGIDACVGDSGVPLITSDGIQVGIASWGIGCAQPEYPGVYSSISAVIDWIDDQICEFSDFPLCYASAAPTSSPSSMPSSMPSSPTSSPSTMPSSPPTLSDLRVLSGTIPTEIGKLSQLLALDLGNNELTGPIPEELGSLTQLTLLDLSQNRLTGTVPATLESISELAEIILEPNRLSN